ncbi:hypothetical protein ACA910_000977 [Epithemia clementina (nom. ined.)]
MPSGIVEEVQSNKQDQQKVSGAMSPPESKNGSDNKNNDEKDTEEGVEVVLGDERNPTMVDSPRRVNHEGVFRPPQAVRPQAMRAPSGPPPHTSHPSHGQPYVQSSGSWGYGLPPHHPSSGEYRGRPYPVPPYNTSAPSFEEPAYHAPASHYTPPVTYPGYRSSEEVNVISPNHKGDPHYRPPHTPRSRNMPPPNYYHYPPTSPVSRQEMMAPSTPGAMQRGRSHPPIRRGGAGEGPYSRAQRGEYPHDEVAWSRYPISHSPGRDRPHPSVVTESSFDSEHISRESQSHGSHPATPRSSHPHPHPPQPVPSAPHDPHYQFYGGGGSWGSFDSAVGGGGGGGPPPHFDDQRYYGYPPDSPYGAYHHPHHPPTPYSPSELYRADSFHAHPGVHPVYSGHHPPHPPHLGSYPYSYDEDERAKGYHSDGKDKKGRMTPKTSNKSNSNNMLLPKAAEEVDFDVTDPPPEPVTQPSDKPVCESLADVNGYDVLCGRGGGTNSQIGNRRFRKLVNEFQPTYLLARRKEKPLLARSIVLIIRKRGGRFLKKDDDTGELYEVGDTKAEAKTSQALREGLDVRATKSAASSLLEKKKKKQQEEADEAAEAAAAEEEDSPKKSKSANTTPASSPSKDEKKTPPRESSPPTLPRLHGEEIKSGNPHPHSPEQFAHSKRRRTRPVNAPSDRFFPEFCPPRADLGRPSSPPIDDDSSIALAATPMRRNMSRDDSDRYEEPRGCAGIAFDVMTGAATGSFCLGPTGWRR